MLGDILPYQNYIYEVILCRPDKTEISVLDTINLEVSKRFNGIDQLNFEIDWQNNDWVIKENPDFNIIMADYLLKLITKIDDEIIEEKLFIIDSSPENYIEKDYRNVSAYSYEYSWTKKILRGYKQTAKLYDDTGSNGIINYIISTKLLGTWSVNYISPSLLNNYRSFDFAENTLIDVIKQLEETYACLFFFDTINQTIDIVLASESGVNTGLFLDEQKLKTLKREILNNEIYTRLYVYGKDNLTIASKNVTGQLYIDNFTFYRTSEYMSQSLLTALNNYDLVLETYEGVFQSNLTQLSNLNTQLLTKENELVALNAEKLIIEDAMFNEKNTYSSNSLNWTNLYYSLQNKLSQISVKQTEINNIKSQVATVNTQIFAINQSVSYQNNFTTTQLKELDYFIREKSITLSDIDSVDTLYNEAKYQLQLCSIPLMQIEVSSIDLLSCVEFQHDWSKLKLGDIINVYYDKMNIVKNIISPPSYLEDFNENSNTLLYNVNMPFYEDTYGIENNTDKTISLRLVAIKHNPSSNVLDLTFCTTNILSTDNLYLRDINVKVNRFATTFEVQKPSYEEFQNVKENILYNGVPINAAETEIQAGNLYISQRGFIGKDIGITNGQLEYFNDKIVISSDGMLTYDTLISGNGLQLVSGDKTNRVLITRGNGFQLDVWNYQLNDWRNAIYLGLTNGTPSLHIDNGYISLIKITNGLETNKILIDPSVGIEISKNIGTLELPIWDKEFYVDIDGNLIAKNLRTAPSSSNYIELKDQWLTYMNGGFEKMILGMYDVSGNYYPYIKMGVGDGTSGNVFQMYKTGDGLYMVFTNSDHTESIINFRNNVGIGFYGSLVDFKGVTTVDFTGVNVVGLPQPVVVTG